MKWGHVWRRALAVVVGLLGLWPGVNTWAGAGYFGRDALVSTGVFMIVASLGLVVYGLVGPHPEVVLVAYVVAWAIVFVAWDAGLFP
jgi:hypothetical protein